MSGFLFCILVFLLSLFTDFGQGHRAQLMLRWTGGIGTIFVLVVSTLWQAFRGHEEQERKMKEDKEASEVAKQLLAAEIQRLEDRQTCLTVGWNAIPPCLVESRCRLEIHNTNTLFAAQSVRVQLMLIDPVPRSLRNPVFPVNLPRIDENERTVNPDCRAYFELFAMTEDDTRRNVVIRDENGNEPQFWPDDTVEQIMHSYRLVIRVSSLEGPSREFQFGLRFPTRGNEPFYLDPIR
jgi:hypothetical protein